MACSRYDSDICELNKLHGNMSFHAFVGRYRPSTPKYVSITPCPSTRALLFWDFVNFTWSWRTSSDGSESADRDGERGVLRGIWRSYVL